MTIGGDLRLVGARNEPNLTALIMYTAAGGSFFVIQAEILAWKQRRSLKAA
jgi:hypothetical protein